MKRRVNRELLSYSTFLLFLGAVVLLHGAPRQGTPTASGNARGPGEVTVPARPAEPLYKGQQGEQKSEIDFAPPTRLVTVKLQVEDPSGYFLPNLRRENFAVYEDGVRQKNVSVEVEHSPVSIALLIELGGRYRQLNKALGTEVQPIARELLDFIGRDDKIAVFAYSSTLQTLADFNGGHEALDGIVDKLMPPDSSEANFYDALIETLQRVKPVSGRKAIIVVSSGVDTFSKANFQQVLEAVRTSGTPIYVIGLDSFLRLEASIYGPEAPFSRIDWNAAQERLVEIARASGGRDYLPQIESEVAGIYDDIMENLRIRYVITYVSSNSASSGPSRKVQVELIDPTTSKPLSVRDSNGKPITAKVFVQESYTPGTHTGS
jgi:VWFA-related protein